MICVTNESRDSVLKWCQIGPSKDNLSVLNPTESLTGACSIFGSFVKFVVELQSTNLDTSRISTNVFSILMAAQRSLHELEKSGLPRTVTERTQKDRLYNNLIQFSKEQGLKWRDPSSIGASFLKKLMNILWYIDGHHDVIGERSSKIPDVFSQFNGYNCP